MSKGALPVLCKTRGFERRPAEAADSIRPEECPLFPRTASSSGRCRGYRGVAHVSESPDAFLKVARSRDPVPRRCLKSHAECLTDRLRVGLQPRAQGPL